MIDTGRGMSPEVRDSLFSYRAISRKVGGTGLGTKIVKTSWIPGIGGTITVESRPKERGRRSISRCQSTARLLKLRALFKLKSRASWTAGFSEGLNRMTLSLLGSATCSIHDFV